MTHPLIIAIINLKNNTMKKTPLLLIGLLLAVGVAKAQSFAALENYSFGWYFQWMEGLAEMRDGNILTCTRLLNADASGHYTDDYGYCFLKLNREDATIMDSVFLPDSYTNFFMLEPHPSSDGYLFINQVYDSLTESNFMKIRHFHDDLVFDDEISTPLVDTVYGGTDHFLIEENSFIMLSSDGHSSHTFQRFAFEGELLDRVVCPDSVCPYWEVRGLKVWNDSPREFVFTGYKPSPAQCSFYILDSLLQLKETIALEHTPQYPNLWFQHTANNVVESLDESTHLLATGFEEGYSVNPDFKLGVQVTKRDKATHDNLKTVYFPFHVISIGVFFASPYVVDVKQTEEGYIYLAYGDISGMNKFSVVLLDSDLNILWQQYYLNLDDYDMMYCMKKLHDGGLGLVGYDAHDTKVFALFINNEYDALEEYGITIRPYTYWPNPVENELHLHFSPDVQPTQIELYDLQGHLVRMQKNGLESLEMNGLPSGTYTMCVTLEGGKVFTDKVMKD